MIIYLIGFPGSGKTTVGRKLASRLNYTFTDLDELITSSTGSSIAELFAQGEDRFREAEVQALHATESMTDMVIATGGGAPCFHSNLLLMKSTGITIYLKMSAGALFYRLVRSKIARPLLADKTDVELMEYIVEALGVREKFYSKAHLTVEGENADVETLTELVQSAIKERGD